MTKFVVWKSLRSIERIPKMNGNSIEVTIVVLADQYGGAVIPEDFRFGYFGILTETKDEKYFRGMAQIKCAEALRDKFEIEGGVALGIVKKSPIRVIR